MHLPTALLLTPLFAAPAAGQGGQVLWKTDLDGFSTMSQPRVAPDGTIYVVTNELYAIAPDGEILWTAPASRAFVDVGADGTVYTASDNTIFAYAPDGTELWRFDEDPAGLGIHSGPTIGPDGNLYAVFLFGMSVVSLTPQGALRWSVQTVSNNDGPDLGRIVFGPGKLYFSEDRVPGCNPWYGLTAISFDGTVEWCRSISGVVQPPVGPEATLDGRAIVWQNALPGIQLQVWTPDGELDWAQSFFPLSLGVGPDNNLYAWHSGSTLVSMTADGAPRFSRPQPINNFPWKPVVSPDVAAVVSGSVYGFGDNGRIVAADPEDGDTLWSLAVTGASAGAGAPAAFSTDGSVVYVPINTVSFDVPDQLWAIRVDDSPFERTCAGTVAACPCANAGAAGHGCENSSATGGAELLAGGSTQPDTVVLEASGVKPDALSIFLQGDASAGGVAFGDGVRCVAGDLLRLYVRNATGELVRAPIAGEPSISARSAALGDPIAPGTKRHYQVYYRDPVEGFCPAPAGGTFNASSGMSVLW